MSIKALRKQQAEALEAYHKINSELEAQIVAIREKRGQKLKAPSWKGYHEQGRDRESSHG